MKINIIGGGPAGLYFALLMKKADSGHSITVHERNPASNTFGWGVVFSQRTLSLLAEGDEQTQQRLLDSALQWENVDVYHRGEKISVAGNHFAGAARIELLKVLHQRCRETGVELNFESRVDDPRELLDADLVLAADGVRSMTRDAFAGSFQPQLDLRKNRYIWLGTPRLFHGLSLIFREHGSSLFMAHAYKFSPDCSTFIVEVGEDTWQQAGLADRSEEDTLKLLGEVFADDLQGAPLLTNNSPWIQFLLVKNACWYHDNVVLVGDACHTAHFSIGSGTKLALEDSLALYRVCQAEADARQAIRTYQDQRKPVVDALQDAALSSMEWFETAQTKMSLDPIPFAWDLMTRSKRLDDSRLRRRDPQFTAAYDAYREAHPQTF